ncbi:MAG: KH domain-containing protein [Candidatus Thalassarchaeaceae archaeon]|nr:KH domain-containing protein [Candidatus Thalassarchaeaceae archaeon]
METSVRVPKDRIAVLIGKGGATRKGLEMAAKVTLEIDSNSGDVSITWDPAKTDPVKMMKFPELIKAIGRGMSPKKAIKLMEDDCYFQLYDMREWVGKQHLQQKRMRGRLIGSEGKIRRFIESNTGCEMAVYGSTVVIIGDEEGLPLASNAVERILRGSEHGTVIKALERERRDRKMAARRLEYIQEKGDSDESGFEHLVPGLAEARQRSRRYKSSQIDPEDKEAVAEMMDLAEDESVSWSEE